MPVAFQVGLFCTVLALAAVRFLRSLRLVVRAGRGAAQAPAMISPPGAQASGSCPPDPQATQGGQVDLRKSGWAIPAIRPDAKGAARATPVEPSEQEAPGETKGGGAGDGARARSRFNWERWYHLAVLWGLVLFCGPFLFGLAAPERMRDASLALDTRIAGGPPVPDLASLRERVESAQSAGRFTGLTPQVFRVILAEALASGALAEELEVFAELSAREVRKAWLVLLALGAAVAAAGLASGLAARRRSAWATWTFAAAGVVAACGALALAGPVASRLSGAMAARKAIETYASTLTIPAGKAGGLSGPVRLVGRPMRGARSGARHFYFRGPGGGGEGSAVYAGFRLGAVTVAACSPSDCRVVRPHVRLGAAGREHFIGADENVVVMGVLEDGVLRPRRGYPLVVAPADEAAHPAPGGPLLPTASADERRWMRKVMEAVAADLAGTGARRARWLALLQAAFGSALAWSMALFAASATERLLGPPRPGALPAGRKKGEIAETL